MRAFLPTVGGLFASFMVCTSALAQTVTPYAAPPPTAPYAPAPSDPAARLRYREGVASPPGYHLEESPQKGLVISGAVVLGTTWLLSAAIGATSTNSSDRWLFLPVAGPFADLVARGTRDSCTGSGDVISCSHDSVVLFYLAVDGIVQTTGGVLLLMGFVSPKKEYVGTASNGSNERGPRIVSWTITPQLAHGSQFGLALTGTVF
jgi:hypothetical protein